MSYFWSKKNFSDIDLTDMLVSYIKLINNSRMYYRCLVLTFQFLNLVSNNKKKENWKSYIGFSIGYFGRSKLTKSHYNFKMLWVFFLCLSLIDIVSCLVLVERHEQTEWADGSSLHGAPEAHTTAVLQPGCERPRETEPVWTVLTRGKNQV